MGSRKQYNKNNNIHRVLIVCQAFINSCDPHGEVGSVVIAVFQMQKHKDREVS